MKACIHRGAKEIGGTCVEIESQGRRIVLDVGQPLDVDDPNQVPLHPVPGFEWPDPSLLGVIISHPHLDHYGLAHRLPKETLFLMDNRRSASCVPRPCLSPLVDPSSGFSISRTASRSPFPLSRSLPT